jgi:hypothetical protein
MIKYIKIGKLNVSLVLRHRLEKQKRFSRTFTKWQVSFWFNKSRIVGVSNFGNPNEWKNNTVNSYMVGFELLLFKAWINWDFGGMHLDIDC